MTLTEIQFKATKDLAKKRANQLQNYIESNDAGMKELSKKLEILIEQLIQAQDGILGSAPRDFNNQEILGIRLLRSE